MKFGVLFVVTVILMIIFFIIMLITLRDINSVLEENELQAAEALDHMEQGNSTKYYFINSAKKDNTTTTTKNA